MSSRARRLPAPLRGSAVRVAAAVRSRRRSPASLGAAVRTRVEKILVTDPRARRAAIAGWTGSGVVPRMLDQTRYADLTLGLGRRLVRKGMTAEAVNLYDRAESRMGRSPDRLRVTVARMALDLGRGEIPADIWERVRDLLDAADTALAAGDPDTAGTRLQEAFNLSYHRAHHFEDRISPLTSDPGTFLAPYLASTAYQASARPSSGVRPARSHVAGRPHRILFTTFMNWNFVNDLVDDYAATPDVEVRRLDLKEIPDGPWRAQPVDLVKDRLRQMTGGTPLSPPAEVREAFDWADTVVVEWGHRALPWVSMLPNVRAKVVARIHSYEAFTPMPQHTDWAGVDDVIFVSPHIRALVEATVPAMVETTRRHTIGNRNLLHDFQLPKRPGAARTLGLVGWNNVTKDPAWALDLLEELRRQDDRWRLRLVGGEFARTGLTGPAIEYRDLLEKRLAQLGDAVERTGFSHDVPDALRDIGVIVSSSRREGTHEGLIQGVASGAFPVVRNWPYVAGWGGPATLFPHEWIVETPADAARRLLDAFEGDVQKSCRDMAQWIVDRYDWAAVRPQLDAVLLEP